MMLMLRDREVVEIFDSSKNPPTWVEAIDIENDEYRFCGERARRYAGVIIRPAGHFRSGALEIRPEGKPQLKNVLNLVDAAVGIEPNARHIDLESLR